MAKGKPIYFIKPYEAYCDGAAWLPYYYEEELKEKGLI